MYIYMVGGSTRAGTTVALGKGWLLLRRSYSSTSKLKLLVWGDII